MLALAPLPARAQAPWPEGLRTVLQSYEALPVSTWRKMPEGTGEALERIARSDPSTFHRLRALHALKAWPVRQVQVAAELSDADAPVRLRRSAAMVWIGLAADRPQAWLHLLNDRSPRVREGVVTALAQAPLETRKHCASAVRELAAREQARPVLTALREWRVF